MAEAAPSDRRPVQVPPAEVPSLKTLASLAVFVVIVAGLYLAREVLIPVTLAILLSFILAPLVKLMRWMRLAKAPAVMLAVVAALGLVLAVGAVIGTQIAQLAQDAPRYEVAIKDKVGAVRGTMVKMFAELSNSIETKESAGKKPATPGAAPQQKLLPVEVHQPEPSPFEIAARILEPVVSPLATLSIVFIVAVFILMQREDLRNRLIRLFGSRDLHRTTIALDEAAERLSRYFLSQLGINAAFGAVIATGLFFIGVPSPLLWGIIGGLLRFVPFVGAILAVIPPLALAAGVDYGWTLVIWTAILFGAVEFIVGQVVEPLLYGHSTGLSPISVVVAAIFWTWLWGPIGLILSTPLTVCLVVLGRHVERLEFLDVMLGDRPPLTDVESFYQRMLAGDPDEALDQAETTLKSAPLVKYYDDVVLAGLRLASNDVLRGVLLPDRVEAMKRSVESLLEDLSTYAPKVLPAPDEKGKAAPVPPAKGEAEGAGSQVEPVDDVPVLTPEELPPAWRTDGAIRCVAGRGPLDEAAATMLAQLLRLHGLPSQVVSHEAVSRANIGTFDATGAAMICVSYLEIDGSPSHLRYLLRRLRQRAPKTPIVVGFWASGDRVLSDERLQAAVGAEHYATSLQGALTMCLEAARAASPREQTDPAPLSLAG